MIELRWALQHRGYVEKERILQLRYQRTVLIEENHETGYRMVRREEWSEWQDVPEVDVPNNGSPK